MKRRRVLMVSVLMALATMLCVGEIACTKTLIDFDTFFLEAGEHLNISLEVKKGDLLELKVKVEGGIERGLDIGIKVVDQEGWVIVPYRRIIMEKIVIRAEESGFYVILLDNSYSLITPKVVSMESRITRKIFP